MRSTGQADPLASQSRGARGLLAVVSATLAALAALAALVPGGPGGRPAAAATCPATVTGAVTRSLTLDGPGATVTVTGAGSGTQDFCLSGAASDQTVLEIAATVPTGGPDFFLCAYGVPDQSKPTTTSYARSSHISGKLTQQVAFSHPAYLEYEADQFSLASGALGVANCAGGLVPGPATSFTVTARYYTLPSLGPANGFSFATGHLPKATPSTSTPGGGEPSIAVDSRHGDRVYVTTPTGVPSGAGCVLNGNLPSPGAGCGGVNVWYSEDAGRTFTFCNASLPNGGGDSTLALDAAGSIYSGDLAATHVNLQKLSATSSGPAVPAAGSDCGFANLPPSTFAADREWLTTYLADPAQGTGAADVYLSYHDLVTAMVYECTSTNGGQLTLPCVPMITSPGVAVASLTNTINGNQVTDSQGNIYSIFGTSTTTQNINNQTSGPINSLYVATSPPGGTAFTDYPIISAPVGDSLAQIFPVIAIDGSGNLYAVWSQGSATGGPTAIYLSASTDRGKTWTPPTKVNAGSLTSNVLPWVVAGGNGGVDVVWVASGSPSASQDPTARWYVYMAQSLDATSAAPTFAQTVVSPDPVRFGQVCSNGLLCTGNGDDGRILLDFISVALDSHCNANISYGNAGPDTEAAGMGFNPYTDYAHQVSGGTVGSICLAGATAGLTATVPVPGTGAGEASAAAMAGGAMGLLGLAIVGAGHRRRSRRQRRREA